MSEPRDGRWKVSAWTVSASVVRPHPGLTLAPLHGKHGGLPVLELVCAQQGRSFGATSRERPHKIAPS
jgi:hypothetical protein